MGIVLSHAIAAALFYLRPKAQHALTEDSTDEGNINKPGASDDLEYFLSSECLLPVVDAESLTELREAIRQTISRYTGSNSSQVKVYLKNPVSGQLVDDHCRPLPSSGFISEVLSQRGKTVISASKNQDSISDLLGNQHTNDSNGANSVFLLPIPERGTHKGVGLVVVESQSSSISNTDTKRLELCIKQASVTYEAIRARGNKDTESTPASLFSLIQLCSELNDQDAVKLEQKVLRYLLQHTGAETGFILLVVPETQELFCQAVGDIILQEEIRFTESKDMVEKIVGKTLKSFLCVPVTVADGKELLALACVINKENDQEFTDGDTEIICQTFKYTATVLSSTLAFQNERKLKNQTQALLHVARKLFTRLGKFLPSQTSPPTSVLSNQNHFPPKDGQGVFSCSSAVTKLRDSSDLFSNTIEGFTQFHETKTHGEEPEVNEFRIAPDDNEKFMKISSDQGNQDFEKNPFSSFVHSSSVLFQLSQQLQGKIESHMHSLKKMQEVYWGKGYTQPSKSQTGKDESIQVMRGKTLKEDNYNQVMLHVQHFLDSVSYEGLDSDLHDNERTSKNVTGRRNRHFDKSIQTSNEQELSHFTDTDLELGVEFTGFEESFERQSIDRNKSFQCESGKLCQDMDLKDGYTDMTCSSFHSVKESKANIPSIDEGNFLFEIVEDDDDDHKADENKKAVIGRNDAIPPTNTVNTSRLWERIERDLQEKKENIDINELLQDLSFINDEEYMEGIAANENVLSSDSGFTITKMEMKGENDAVEVNKNIMLSLDKENRDLLPSMFEKIELLQDPCTNEEVLDSQSSGICMTESLYPLSENVNPFVNEENSIDRIEANENVLSAEKGDSDLSPLLTGKVEVKAENNAVEFCEEAYKIEMRVNENALSQEKNDSDLSIFMNEKMEEKAANNDIACSGNNYQLDAITTVVCGDDVSQLTVENSVPREDFKTCDDLDFLLAFIEGQTNSESCASYESSSPSGYLDCKLEKSLIEADSKTSGNLDIEASDRSEILSCKKYEESDRMTNEKVEINTENDSTDTWTGGSGDKDEDGEIDSKNDDVDAYVTSMCQDGVDGLFKQYENLEGNACSQLDNKESSNESCLSGIYSTSDTDQHHDKNCSNGVHVPCYGAPDSEYSNLSCMEATELKTINADDCVRFGEACSDEPIAQSTPKSTVPDFQEKLTDKSEVPLYSPFVTCNDDSFCPMRLDIRQESSVPDSCEIMKNSNYFVHDNLCGIQTVEGDKHMRADKDLVFDSHMQDTDPGDLVQLDSKSNLDLNVLDESKTRQFPISENFDLLHPYPDQVPGSEITGDSHPNSISDDNSSTEAEEDHSFDIHVEPKSKEDLICENQEKSYQSTTSRDWSHVPSDQALDCYETHPDPLEDCPLEDPSAFYHEQVQISETCTAQELVSESHDGCQAMKNSVLDNYDDSQSPVYESCDGFQILSYQVFETCEESLQEECHFFENPVESFQTQGICDKTFTAQSFVSENASDSHLHQGSLSINHELQSPGDTVPKSDDEFCSALDERNENQDEIKPYHERLYQICPAQNPSQVDFDDVSNELETEMYQSSPEHFQSVQSEFDSKSDPSLFSKESSVLDVTGPDESSLVSGDDQAFEGDVSDLEGTTHSMALRDEAVLEMWDETYDIAFGKDFTISGMSDDYNEFERKPETSSSLDYFNFLKDVPMGSSKTDDEDRQLLQGCESLSNKSSDSSIQLDSSFFSESQNDTQDENEELTPFKYFGDDQTVMMCFENEKVRRKLNYFPSHFHVLSYDRSSIERGVESCTSGEDENSIISEQASNSSYESNNMPVEENAHAPGVIPVMNECGLKDAITVECGLKDAITVECGLKDAITVECGLKDAITVDNELCHSGHEEETADILPDLPDVKNGEMVQHLSDVDPQRCEEDLACPGSSSAKKSVTFKVPVEERLIQVLEDDIVPKHGRLIQVEDLTKVISNDEDKKLSDSQNITYFEKGSFSHDFEEIETKEEVASIEINYKPFLDQDTSLSRLSYSSDLGVILEEESDEDCHKEIDVSQSSEENMSDFNNGLVDPTLDNVGVEKTKDIGNKALCCEEENAICNHRCFCEMSLKLTVELECGSSNTSCEDCFQNESLSPESMTGKTDISQKISYTENELKENNGFSLIANSEAYSSLRAEEVKRVDKPVITEKEEREEKMTDAQSVASGDQDANDSVISEGTVLEDFDHLNSYNLNATLYQRDFNDGEYQNENSFNPDSPEKSVLNKTFSVNQDDKVDKGYYFPPVYISKEIELEPAQRVDVNQVDDIDDNLEEDDDLNASSEGYSDNMERLEDTEDHLVLDSSDSKSSDSDILKQRNSKRKVGHLFFNENCNLTLESACLPTFDLCVRHCQKSDRKDESSESEVNEHCPQKQIFGEKEIDPKDDTSVLSDGAKQLQCSGGSKTCEENNNCEDEISQCTRSIFHKYFPDFYEGFESSDLENGSQMSQCEEYDVDFESECVYKADGMGGAWLKSFVGVDCQDERKVRYNSFFTGNYLSEGYCDVCPSVEENSLVCCEHGKKRMKRLSYDKIDQTQCPGNDTYVLKSDVPKTERIGGPVDVVDSGSNVRKKYFDAKPFGDLIHPLDITSEYVQEEYGITDNLSYSSLIPHKETLHLSQSDVEKGVVCVRAVVNVETLYDLPGEKKSDVNTKPNCIGYKDIIGSIPVHPKADVWHDDLTKLLREIMQEARNLTDAERCSVFLLDKDSDELVAMVFDGITAEDKERLLRGLRTRQDAKVNVQGEIRLPKTQGIAGHVATTGTLLNIRDAYSHPLFYRGIDDSTGFRTRNILCFPIKDEEGVVLGVAQLCNKKTFQYFTTFDEDIASAFAVYCCISISHSLMYKKVIDIQYRNSLANELMMFHMKSLMYKKLQDTQYRQRIANELMVFHLNQQVPTEEVKIMANMRIPSITNFSPKFDTFDFPPRSIPECQTVLSCLSMFEDLGFMSRWRIKLDILVRFLLMVKKGYRNPPYHNWMHAYAVTHFCYLLIKNLHLHNYLEDIEILALFVSCMCHDIDHRGTTNSFQVQSQTVLAALYSSEGSVMERHHLAQSMCILNTEGSNLFEQLSSKEYQTVLDLMKEIILATDVAHHLGMVREQEQMADSGGYDKNDPTQRHMLLCLLMTACDLSDQTKNWSNTKLIASLVYQEFFSQGDLEKALGKNPLEMMDRERACIPELQIAFLDNIAAPVYRILVKMFPDAGVVQRNVEDNRGHWVHIRELLQNKHGKQVMSVEEIISMEEDPGEARKDDDDEPGNNNIDESNTNIDAGSSNNQINGR